MHKKREEKRKGNGNKADTEVKYLQPSGKLTKGPSHNKSNNVKHKKKASSGAAAQQAAVPDTGSDSDNEQVIGAVGGQSPRPSTAGSAGKGIEDIFQVSNLPMLADYIDILSHCEKFFLLPNFIILFRKKGNEWLLVVNRHERFSVLLSSNCLSVFTPCYLIECIVCYTCI